MASIRYTGIVAQIKGSIAGTTFQSNRNGFTIRTKPLPRNPRTSGQQGVRIFTAGLAQRWRTLSDADRASWDAVVGSWPAVDAYGDPVTLSGYSVYMRANLGLIIAGTNPSDTGTLPTLLWPIVNPTMTISIAAGTAIWAWAASPVDADNYVVLSASFMMSQGRKFRKTGLRAIAFAEPTDASGIDIIAALTTYLGQSPILGSRIWFTMQVYSMSAGNASLIVPFSCIVVA